MNQNERGKIKNNEMKKIYNKGAPRAHLTTWGGDNGTYGSSWIKGSLVQWFTPSKVHNELFGSSLDHLCTSYSFQTSCPNSSMPRLIFVLSGSLVSV